MSSRNGLRRKIVLPVTVVRPRLAQSQLAHTIDLSETSARLGGLCLLLEPGEVVEIQRESLTARFQVFWMGSPGSALEGQAGVRSLDSDNQIWELNSRNVESNADSGISGNLPVATASLPGEKRWHARMECAGAASVLPRGSQFAVKGEIKDVSLGGIYVEVSAPLPVKAQVSLKMSIEGISFEGTGVVRTSYPLVGMGIRFQEISPENQPKLAQVLEEVALRNAAAKAGPLPPPPAPALAALRLDAYPLRVLVLACQALTRDFDHWKGTHSPAEIEELRLAVHDLQQKLSAEPATELEILDLAETPQSRGGAA